MFPNSWDLLKEDYKRDPVVHRVLNTLAFELYEKVKNDT